MKIERPSLVSGGRVARQSTARLPIDPASASATASILGIPEREFTPRVGDALVILQGEIEGLRAELQVARNKLEQTEKSADQDQLLPLLNRRAFVRELARNISLAGRYGTASSLIYFDLDNFKAVNDAHGHAGGDAVLHQFATVLVANVRDSDYVGRLGGDEFGILLAHADQTQAHKKADLLADLVRRSPTTWNGQAVSLTFAYGVVELKAGNTPEQAMARADEAMYAQKRNRR